MAGSQRLSAHLGSPTFHHQALRSWPGIGHVLNNEEAVPERRRYSRPPMVAAKGLAGFLREAHDEYAEGE
jgi:hypothetical protein